MLQHPDPAVISLLGVFRVALSNRREIDFLEFFFFGINCRTDIGGQKERAACRRNTIANQLKITARHYRLLAGIFYFMGNLDQITTLVEGDYLGCFQRGIARGLQPYLHLFGISGKLILILFRNKQAVVVGQSCSEQAALHDVIMGAFAALEKHQRLILVMPVRMLQQSQTDDIATDGADFGLKKIGLDVYRFPGSPLAALLDYSRLPGPALKAGKPDAGLTLAAGCPEPAGSVACGLGACAPVVALC